MYTASVPRIIWRCKLKVCYVRLWVYIYPWVVWYLSNFSYICNCFWMFQFSMSGSQKWKWEKLRWIKMHWPFNTPGSFFSLRSRELQQWKKVKIYWLLPLCQYLCDLNQHQWSEHVDTLYWRIRVLSDHPGSHKLCVSHSRKICPAACHGTYGWRMGNYHCSKNWNWLKLITIYHSSLSLRFASPLIDSRVLK